MGAGGDNLKVVKNIEGEDVEVIERSDRCHCGHQARFHHIPMWDYRGSGIMSPYDFTRTPLPYTRVCRWCAILEFRDLSRREPESGFPNPQHDVALAAPEPEPAPPWVSWPDRPDGEGWL